MQGPFDQQTDRGGFYMPLLGASPATQFCRSLFARVQVNARTRSVPVGQSGCSARFGPADLFCGYTALFHDESLLANRIIATLFTIFGVLAFVLSAVGLYGVMSFSVSPRTQEFGIRMALGADARRIFRMVMTQGAWHSASGLYLAPAPSRYCSESWWPLR